jgi:hypothetical protein
LQRAAIERAAHEPGELEEIADALRTGAGDAA